MVGRVEVPDLPEGVRKTLIVEVAPGEEERPADVVAALADGPLAVRGAALALGGTSEPRSWGVERALEVKTVLGDEEENVVARLRGDERHVLLPADLHQRDVWGVAGSMDATTTLPKRPLAVCV